MQTIANLNGGRLLASIAQYVTNYMEAYPTEVYGVLQAHQTSMQHQLIWHIAVKPLRQMAPDTFTKQVATLLNDSLMVQLACIKELRGINEIPLYLTMVSPLNPRNVLGSLTVTVYLEGVNQPVPTARSPWAQY